MKKGAVITAVVATLAMSAVVLAFLSNASPYVTVAQARTMPDDRLHLAGDLQKGSVQHDHLRRTLRFRIKDEAGEVVTIVHQGDPPANMGDATKIVAIGGMKGDEFHSDKLLIKCPSKYEGESKGAVARG